MKISDQTHAWGESKICLNDQRCSNKNDIDHIRAHCIVHVLIPFFHIPQCVVCAQLSVRGHGDRRNWFSEEIAQAITLANVSYCHRHISEEPSVAARVIYKKCKKLYRQTKRDILNISLAEGTPCHNCSQRRSYHAMV